MPEPAPKQEASPYSFRLLTAFGIPISLHFTFILFLVWIAYMSRPRAGVAIVFVLVLFACVLLHELGHALAARKFKIETVDITLYPMGGVATLESRPRPRAEFWIALAGPAVNVCIALLLFPFVLLEKGPGAHLGSLFQQTNLLDSVFAANCILAVFNLLPAFPMDGGRVLRAVLARSMPEEKATIFAGTVGKFLSLLLLVIGLFTGSPILMLVAVFVYFAADQEVSMTKQKSMLHGKRMRDAMQVQFHRLDSDALLGTAAQLLSEGKQHDFPIMSGTEVIGILTRTHIANGLSKDGPDGYVAGYMERSFIEVRPEEPLEEAADIFGSNEQLPIVIADESGLQGILTRENYSEYIMREHARTQSKPVSAQA